VSVVTTDPNNAAVWPMTEDKSPKSPKPTSGHHASGHPAGGFGAPKRIGALINQLMARRGYAQVFAAEGLQAVLQSEVGPAIAAAVKVGNIKRGVLNIYVTDSVTMQELAFRKRSLLKKMQAAQPDRVISDLRFHISATATG
jgi:predicted nucleic acid-binding Zn ribbon protein